MSVWRQGWCGRASLWNCDKLGKTVQDVDRTHPLLTWDEEVERQISENHSEAFIRLKNSFIYSDRGALWCSATTNRKQITSLPIEKETFGTGCDITPSPLRCHHCDVHEVSLQLPVSWGRVPAAERQVFQVAGGLVRQTSSHKESQCLCALWAGPVWGMAAGVNTPLSGSSVVAGPWAVCPRSRGEGNQEELFPGWVFLFLCYSQSVSGSFHCAWWSLHQE